MSIIDITKKHKGAFVSAVVDCEVGDEIVYCSGLFCAGVHKDPARLAYDRGVVILYQRRNGQVFDYVAKRIK